MKKIAILCIAVCIIFIVPIFVFADDHSSLLKENASETEIVEVHEEAKMEADKEMNSEDKIDIPKEADSKKKKVLDEYAEIKDSYEEMLNEENTGETVPSKAPALAVEKSNKED